MRSCQGKEKETKTREVKERKGKRTGRIHVAKLTHEVFKRKINRREWEEEKEKAKFKIYKEQCYLFFFLIKKIYFVNS